MEIDLHQRLLSVSFKKRTEKHKGKFQTSVLGGHNFLSEFIFYQKNHADCQNGGNVYLFVCFDNTQKDDVEEEDYTIINTKKLYIYIFILFLLLHHDQGQRCRQYSN
jgi:hypothetical protein